MSKFSISIISLLFLLGANPSIAQNLSEALIQSDKTTAILTIPGMTCPACPITISRALKKIDGVEEVSSNLKGKTIQVTFDSNQTTLQAIKNATKEAGFPSTTQEIISEPKEQ